MKSGFLEKLLERLQLVQPGDMQNYLLALAKEKGFLETIFNAIHEGVLVTDPGGRIIYLNRSACTFFGVEPDASLGLPLGQVVRGIDPTEWSSGANEAINREIEILYPNHRLLNVYMVSLMGDDDELQGRAMILRDVTESRKSTRETIESERFSALQLLAAGVAHEIGNPLNSLGIHLQLAEKRVAKLPERSRKSLADSLAIARREVERLDQIIHQFLRAVRPQPIRPEPADINRILQDSLAFLEVEIRDRNILVESAFDPSLPTLSVDPDQIRQACYNIIRNAFQAMDHGGILGVKTWAGDHHVYIQFSDTGGGIPADQISRIFEPYHTTKEQGSGLGLMIVQRIVRAHGGEVAIESTTGKGVTVTLRLPRLDHRVRLLGPGESQPRALLEDRKP